MPVAFCWQTYPAGKGLQDFGGKNVFAVVDILRPEAPDTPPSLVTELNVANPGREPQTEAILLSPQKD